MQSALELYKQKNGRYPSRCTNATPATSGSWSGQEGTNYACVVGQQYIVGLAPEFIPALPRDPRLLDTQSGYVYTVNSDGSVYKLMAKRTVESETVTYAHALRSCDISNSGQVACTADVQPKDPSNDSACDVAMCDRVHNTYNKPVWCEETDVGFQTTYAVWGGYAMGVDEQAVARSTENIVCEIQ
jgi:hypothetical protein